MDLPAIFQVRGSFNTIDLGSGTGNLAAAAATLPYVVFRPDAACVMTLLATVNSETATDHSLAAACISMVLATAPPRRT